MGAPKPLTFKDVPLCSGRRLEQQSTAPPRIPVVHSRRGSICSRRCRFRGSMPFSHLGLSEKVQAAVKKAGYPTPTPIQEQAIPHVLARRDIVGIAQTGTGKTAAFVLPMLTMLEHGRARSRMPRTLIPEPTRERAPQLAERC